MRQWKFCPTCEVKFPLHISLYYHRDQYHTPDCEVAVPCKPPPIVFTYRCKSCKTKFVKDGGGDPKLALKVAYNNQTNEIAPTPKTIVHECGDERFGIAELISAEAGSDSELAALVTIHRKKVTTDD